jgi:RHS repeat-associated protein
LLDNLQNVVATYGYDSYGTLMNKTGSIDQSFMFSTKQYDTETGLQYFGYRFYNPSVGRWLTRDPLGEFVGLNRYSFVDSVRKPLGVMNLYQYAQNNPINFVDPNGHFFLPGAVVGGIVGGVAGGFGAYIGGDTSVSGISAGAAVGVVGGFVGGGIGIFPGVGAAVGALAGASGAAALGGNPGAIAGATIGGAAGGAIGGLPGLGLAGVAEGAWIGGVWGSSFGYIGQNLYNMYGRQNSFLLTPCK